METNKLDLRPYGVNPSKGRKYESIMYVFALIYNNLQTQVNAYFASCGLSAVQFNLLMLAAYQNGGRGISQVELSKWLIASASNITKLVENPCGLKSLTVMVQLEVAKRICADHTQKDYGAISVFCNYHCDTELLFTVPPEAFDPIPKVTSAVMKLSFRNEKAVAPKNEKHFFSVVKAAFSNRRKTLSNCLMQSFSISREEALGLISAYGLSETIRGEKLSLADFCKLSDLMCQQGK